MPTQRPAPPHSAATAHFGFFYHPTPLHRAEFRIQQQIPRTAIQNRTVAVPVILTLALSSRRRSPPAVAMRVLPAGPRFGRSLQGWRKGRSPRARSSGPEPRTGCRQPASSPPIHTAIIWMRGLVFLIFAFWWVFFFG